VVYQDGQLQVKTGQVRIPVLTDKEHVWMATLPREN